MDWFTRLNEKEALDPVAINHWRDLLGLFLLGVYMNQIVQLLPLEDWDREQFITDNQEAFNFGALEEFGICDQHFGEER